MKVSRAPVGFLRRTSGLNLYGWPLTSRSHKVSLRLHEDSASTVVFWIRFVGCFCFADLRLPSFTRRWLGLPGLQMSKDDKFSHRTSVDNL